MEELNKINPDLLKAYRRHAYDYKIINTVAGVILLVLFAIFLLGVVFPKGVIWIVMYLPPAVNGW